MLVKSNSGRILMIEVSSKLKFHKKARNSEKMLILKMTHNFFCPSAKRQSNDVKINLILLLNEIYRLHYWIVFTFCEVRKRILFVRKGYVIWFDRDSLFVGVNRKRLFLQENRKIELFSQYYILHTVYVITNRTYVAVTWFTGQFYPSYLFCKIWQ